MTGKKVIMVVREAGDGSDSAESISALFTFADDNIAQKFKQAAQ